MVCWGSKGDEIWHRWVEESGEGARHGLNERVTGKVDEIDR